MSEQNADRRKVHTLYSTWMSPCSGTYPKPVLEGIGQTDREDIIDSHTWIPLALHTTAISCWRYVALSSTVTWEIVLGLYTYPLWVDMGLGWPFIMIALSITICSIYSDRIGHFWEVTNNCTLSHKLKSNSQSHTQELPYNFVCSPQSAMIEGLWMIIF